MTTKKTRELKATIKSTQEEIVETIKKRVEEMEKEKDLPIEEQQKASQLSKDTIAIMNAALKGAAEQLKVLKMNRTGSSFFSWEPHEGMNRQQARNFRRTRRKK